MSIAFNSRYCIWSTMFWFFLSIIIEEPYNFSLNIHVFHGLAPIWTCLWSSINIDMNSWHSWQYVNYAIYKLLTIKRDAQLPCALKCFINTPMTRSKSWCKAMEIQKHSKVFHYRVKDIIWTKLIEDLERQMFRVQVAGIKLRLFNTHHLIPKRHLQ